MHQGRVGEQGLAYPLHQKAWDKEHSVLFINLTFYGTCCSLMAHSPFPSIIRSSISIPTCSSLFASCFSIVPLLSSSASSSTFVLFSLIFFICSTRRATSSPCASVRGPDCQRFNCS